MNPLLWYATKLFADDLIKFPLLTWVFSFSLSTMGVVMDIHVLEGHGLIRGGGELLPIRLILLLVNPLR